MTTLKVYSSSRGIMDSDCAVDDEGIFETSAISEKRIDPLTVPRLPARILDCSREP